MTGTLHLIKLAVGAESLADLRDWQTARARAGEELVHVTRNTPKRAAEVLDGGSIYWVVKGVIVARNPIRALRAMTHDGVPHCGIVYEAALVRVAPRAHRPFQGWRYLQGGDAPVDLTGDGDEMPEEMLRELAEMGFL